MRSICINPDVKLTLKEKLLDVPRTSGFQPLAEVGFPSSGLWRSVAYLVVPKFCFCGNACPEKLYQFGGRQMAGAREMMTEWVVEALQQLGGRGTITDVARRVWEQHESDIRAG